MDYFVPAILGEFASRSISFLIDRYSKKPQLAPAKEENIERLERILLRIAAVVEDAEGRSITSQAMLRQLNMLRENMHRGGYVLDTFRCRRAHEHEKMVNDEDEVSYYSLSMSKFNPAKRVRFFATGTGRHGKQKGELEHVLDNLDVAIAGMVEFVLLVKSYPPMMNRQPYNSYMFIEKCMFGRQMEMEEIINFLLHHVDDPPLLPAYRVDSHLGILPIIGPAKFGKSTLVEYVCYDERVRNHFSLIVFLSDNDLLREETPLFSQRDRGVVRHQNISATSNRGRSLVIIELARDVDEDKLMRSLYSASQSCMIPHGSKIIITSRSEKIARLGTTAQPLRLKFLSREAYWYFFKLLAFGSSDPEDHPEVVSVSMATIDRYFHNPEMYEGFTGPFIDISNLACFVRTSTVHESNRHSLCERLSIKARSNHLELRSSRGVAGDHSGTVTMRSKCVLISRLGETMRYCEIYDQCRVGLAREEEEEAPKINMLDVLHGRVAPGEKFEVVLWKSHLPPYYSYIYSCEIREFKSTAATRNANYKKRNVSS